MRTLLAALAAMTSIVIMQRTFAQGVTPVRQAPGLKCMSLDQAALAATRQDELPPIVSAPTPDAQRIGYPGGIVFEKSPRIETNGYVAVVLLNGRNGWIEAARLQPWHPANGGNARCTPMLMSNGLLGQQVR